MTNQTQTGLDQLLASRLRQQQIRGDIAYLCHSASVDCRLKHGIYGLKRAFGQRLKKVFSPQHGLFADAQDNMVETVDSIHPYFKLQVHSLYSHTRIPTPEMLSGLNTILVDLQDVGTRIYTYIYTMTLLLEACRGRDLKVIVLDRPNPIGGEALEGNVLEPDFSSFVGRHPLPVRHGMTIGEIALLAQRYFGASCDLEVWPLRNWRRSCFFEETGLPWVGPSPNLATVSAAFTFVGTVLFEGSNISEGRGTTSSLEIIGHPKLEPFGLLPQLEQSVATAGLEGVVLRPLYFKPMFQKHAGLTCGGYQIHVTDRKAFRPWRTAQLLLRELYRELGDAFAWKDPPYEYEYERRPVDLINGCAFLREWVERQGDYAELEQFEARSLPAFMEQRANVLLYS